MSEASAWAVEEQRKHEERLRDYLQRYNLKEYRNTPHNVLKVLRSAGADEDDVKQAMRLLDARCALFGGPFDHGRIYGRGGVPLVLMGHPYGLDTDDIQTLAAVADCGLYVLVDHYSLYGFGTLRVEVRHAGYDGREKKSEDSQPVRRFVRPGKVANDDSP
jgi:hypothetical protein